MDAVTKVYINVKFADKDTAKAMGAYWDQSVKKWYAPFPEKQQDLIAKYGVAK